MLAPNSSTKVGVVSDGELDGNDGAPAVVETIQVGAELAVSVVAVVINFRGSTTIATRVASVSFSGGASVASERSRTQVTRDNRRVAAHLRWGRMAVMAWSCRERR